MTARPWSRFDPENSLWWLVPTTEWPAYSAAKFFFDAADAGPANSLEIGLSIEKGLDPSIREVYASKKGSAYIMDTGWSWSRLVSEDSADKIGYTVEALRPADVLVRVKAAHVPDPGSFNAHAPRPTESIVEFALSDGQLTSLQLRDPARLLLALNDVRSLRELINGLHLLEKNAWLWVDFYLFERWAPDSEGNVSARQVWNEELVHLIDWLRPPP